VLAVTPGAPAARAVGTATTASTITSARFNR
jgi:hypothetical protein